jgi:ferritin
MKNTVIELNKKFEIISEKNLQCDKAMDALAKLDEFEGKRKMIDEIRQIRNKYFEERQTIMDAITALRKVCEHKNDNGTDAFINSGSDSHYSYEKCGICGKTEKK